MEEGCDDEVRAADGVECDVELCNKAEEVEHGADIGAPNAEGSFEGDFVCAVAGEFPEVTC